MRRLRYCVAMSLDGFIAGPNGEFDWIVMDPDIDFAALMGSFDAALIGRKTFEATRRGPGALPGMKAVVASRTLTPEDCAGAELTADAVATLNELRARPGKDIWLFGGGGLFSSLMDAGEVDAVEIAVIPVLLGGGIPMLAGLASRASLTLTEHTVYPKSGIVMVKYATGRA